MMGKHENHQHRFMFLSLDQYVPKDHLLRQIEELVDFTFIYEKVQHLYSPLGRKSIDPVILIKMLLIGYLYGIESERKLEEEVTLNLAYRWFLGLDLDEPIPDHSTFSQNRKRRFNGSSVFQEVFDHVVMMCVEKGLVTGEIILTDSTHIKAYASSENSEKVELVIDPSDYLKKLDDEIVRMEEEFQKEREVKGVKKRGKKPKAEPIVKEVVKSKADPDTGLLGRPNKPKGFHYLAHTSVDPSHGIITDIHATAANLNDHEVYIERLAVQQNKFPFSIQKAGADKGYDRSVVHVGLKKLHITGYISPIEQHKEIHQDFTYNEQMDAFICSQGKTLDFTYIRKKDYGKTYHKVYAAKRQDCKECLLQESCLSKTSKFKRISTPFGHEEMRKNQERSKTKEYKHISRLRRIWCEGTFGCLKQKHNLFKTYKRGIKKIQEQCLFSALALNLKRMVKALK